MLSDLSIAQHSAFCVPQLLYDALRRLRAVEEFRAAVNAVEQEQIKKVHRA